MDAVCAQHIIRTQWNNVNILTIPTDILYPIRDSIRCTVTEAAVQGVDRGGNHSRCTRLNECNNNRLPSNATLKRGINHSSKSPTVVHGAQS